MAKRKRKKILLAKRFLSLASRAQRTLKPPAATMATQITSPRKKGQPGLGWFSVEDRRASSNITRDHWLQPPRSRGGGKGLCVPPMSPEPCAAPPWPGGRKC